MKLVKLDRRHKLYNRGFTHAFKCAYSSDKDVTILLKYFARVYGDNRLDKRGPWYAGFGTSRMTVRTEWGGEYKTNPYWIAVRSEADVTMALLASGIECS